jgi:ribosomal protein S18 acetylase RimI-like enzyme
MIVRRANSHDRNAIKGMATVLALETIPSTIFVAEINNKIVGFAGHDAGQLVVYVSGGWRRSSIGKALARAIIDHVAPGKLSMCVSPSNVAGQAFCRSLGLNTDTMEEESNE